MFRPLMALIAVLASSWAFGAQQHLNTTTDAADTLQLGAIKIEANFTDLYQFLYAPITGAVTIASGTNTSVLSAGIIQNSNFASVPPYTAKCNFTSLSAAPTDCTPSQLIQLLGFSATSSDQVLASPCGTSGAVSLRSLCAQDLPNLVGPVTSAAGVTTIQPAVITHAMQVAAPAQTIQCNPSSSSGTPQDCSVATVNALLGTSGGGGGGGGSTLTNVMDLCAYSGVDPTGVTDSLAAVTTAFNAYGGTNTTIQVNCPILLNVRSSANQIYVKSNTNVSFGAGGSFIVNNVGVNTFMMVNITKGIWTCANDNGCISYQANPGALMAGCGPNCGVYSSGVAAEYAALKTYLSSNGVTMGTGGNPAWQGQSPFLPIFNIRGNTTGIVFRNMTVSVPANASPAQYIPTVFGLYFEYTPGTTATSGNSALNYSVMAFPTDIEFDHVTLDGYMMGFQGSCDCRFSGTVGKRYADMQDGTSGSITFSAGLASGATSASLSSSVYPSGWPLPTGIYAVGLSNAQTICMTLTTGSLAATSFINCSSGASLPTSSTATSAGTTGNMGGNNVWFAPPHLFYIWDQLVAGTPQRLKLNNTADLGPDHTLDLLSAERSTSSGTILSLKTSPTNNTEIDDYLSLRGEGGLDLEPCTSTCGARFSNIKVVYNSATVTSGGGDPVWGARFLGLINNLEWDGVSFWDTAAEPLNNPLNGSLGWAASTNLVFRNLRYFYNDYPLAATWYPGFVLGGNDQMKLTGEIYFNNFSGSVQNKQVIYASGSNVVMNSDIDVTVFGWRQYPMTFTTAPAIGDTTETLSSSVYPTGWPYGTVNAKITLSDGSVRYATATNGSNTLGTFKNAFGVAQPVSAVATVNATVGNMLTSSYTGYRPKITISMSGKATGNHVHVRDVFNNWESTSDGQTTIERWTQEAAGQPNTPSVIQFPTYFAITNWSWQVNTALTGVTGPMAIGTTDATSSLCSTCNVNTSNSQYPLMSPLVSTGNYIALTPASGTVTGGSAQLSVTGSSMWTTQ